MSQRIQSTVAAVWGAIIIGGWFVVAASLRAYDRFIDQNGIADLKSPLLLIAQHATPILLVLPITWILWSGRQTRRGGMVTTTSVVIGAVACVATFLFISWMALASLHLWSHPHGPMLPI